MLWETAKEIFISIWDAIEKYPNLQGDSSGILLIRDYGMLRTRDFSMAAIGVTIPMILILCQRARKCR